MHRRLPLDPAALRADVDALFDYVRAAGRGKLLAAGAAWDNRWGPISRELGDAVERSRLAALEHGLYELRQAVIAESTALVRAVLVIVAKPPPYSPMRAVRDAATAVALGCDRLLHPSDVDRLTGPFVTGFALQEAFRARR